MSAQTYAIIQSGKAMATYRGKISENSVTSCETKQTKIGYKWINRVCVMAILVFTILIIAFNQQYTDLLR